MFAIWLLFDKDDNNYLTKIIEDLSNKYKSVPFLPHITTYGLVETNLQLIEKIVQSSIKGVKPFLVEKNKISYSKDFWKTLFIEIKQNIHLCKINKKLADELTKFSKYEFLPHASLVYKNMDEKVKEQIANNLVIKDSFTVSKIAILDFSENISDWKLVREYEFEKF